MADPVGLDPTTTLLVALLGTALGIGLGTFLGWAVVRSLDDQGFDTLTIPGVRIAIIAALGAVAGAMVATLPARRAASATSAMARPTPRSTW